MPPKFQPTRGHNRKRTRALNEWLLKTNEEPLEPLLPVIDAHHHFIDNPKADTYDHEALPYEKINPKGALLFGNNKIWGNGALLHYDREELQRDLQGNNVVATVYMEAGYSIDESKPEHLQPVGETLACAAVARRCQEEGVETPRLCHGIVSKADLRLSSELFDQQLQAHEEAAAGLFRGVRHSLADDPEQKVSGDPNLPTEKDEAQFIQNLQQLGKRGLVWDTWCFHTNIRRVASFARNAPGTTVVLDHVGMPLGVGPYASQKASILKQWESDIIEIAKCPNVVCKVGGCLQPASGFEYELRTKPPLSEEVAKAVEPYYAFALQAFGAERCMFESNFPMDRASCNYTTLLNASKRIAQKYLSRDEQVAFFSGTATRVYGLPPLDHVNTPDPKLGRDIGVSPTLSGSDGGSAGQWIVQARTCLVRDGVDLASAEVGRFKQGAVLEEQARQGSRLHVVKISGDGPSRGWVSITVSGKTVVEKL